MPNASFITHYIKDKFENKVIICKFYICRYYKYNLT